MGILYCCRTTVCSWVRVFAWKNVLEEPLVHVSLFLQLSVLGFEDLPLPAPGPVDHLEWGLGARREHDSGALWQVLSTGPVSWEHKLGVSRCSGRTWKTKRNSPDEPRGKDVVGPWRAWAWPCGNAGGSELLTAKQQSQPVRRGGRTRSSGAVGHADAPGAGPAGDRGTEALEAGGTVLGGALLLVLCEWCLQVFTTQGRQAN